MKKGLIVANVQQNSIAAEMEIEAGDLILQIDRRPVRDILDLQYYTANDRFSMIIEKKNNHEIWELDIEKEPEESLGIDIQSIGTEGLLKCRNQCLFCFVRQLPRGMRKSLYDRVTIPAFPDQGSYITLSNLKPADFERITALHISPLYISVHAWDPAVRRTLMGNPAAGKLQEQMQKLIAAEITLHTQIVLVPGYNDGPVLEETVRKLAELYRCSVHRRGSCGAYEAQVRPAALKDRHSAEAASIIDCGLIWQKEFQARTGKNLVYFSDEFYVLSVGNSRDFRV